MVLFASAWGLIGGRQQKVQFSEGMREIQAKIQSVIGDVNNGFFKNENNLGCNLVSQPSLPPNIAMTRPQVAASAAIDKNNVNQFYPANCIFFGKAIQFGNGSSLDRTIVHTILANAVITVNSQPTRVDTLRTDYLKNNLVLPTAISAFNDDYPNPWGIEYKPGKLAESQYNTIVFIGGFGLTDASPSPLTSSSDDQTVNEGGASTVTPVAMPANLTAGGTAASVAGEIDRPLNYLNSTQTAIKPFDKTTVCFTDGGRVAAIVFAKNSAGQLTTELQYNPGTSLC